MVEQKNFKLLSASKLFIPSKSADDMSSEYQNGSIEEEEAKPKKIYFLDDILDKINKKVYFNGSDVLKGLQKVLVSALDQNPSEVNTHILF